MVSLLSRLCLLLAVVALLAPFVGCRRAPEGARDALRIGNGPEPKALDPQITTGTTEINLHMAFFEGLTAPDPRTMAPEPGVALSWESSDLARRWIFRLRPGAVWSDGRPLTSADFAFAFRRMLSPELGAANATLLYVLDGAEAFHRGQADFAAVGVATPDAETLVLRLGRSVPDLPARLMHPAWFPVPRHAIEALGGAAARDNPWARPGTLVGNGPYRLVAWEEGQRVVGEANPHYWDAARLRIRRLEFHHFADSATEERAFLARQLDGTEALPPARVRAYRAAQDPRLRLDPYLGTYYFLLNTRVPALADPRVRRALSLAIDREALCRKVLGAGQSPARRFTPPGLPGYVPPPDPVGDIHLARTLLAQAGYPGGRGFPALTILFNTSEAHRQIAEAIQEMWRRELGVSFVLDNQEFQTYLDTRASGRFDVARAVWIGDYISPETFLDVWESNSGNNFSGWADPAYDAALAEARQAPDASTRAAALARAEARLLEEAPIIPLYFYVSAYLLDPRLQGWHPTPFDWHPYKYLEWARDEAPQR